MTLSASSLAAAVGASVNNVQFTSGALNVPRKIVVIGTYNAGKTPVANTPALCTGPGDAAGKYGRGSMLHRLVVAADKGSQGVETYCLPQAEGVDPVNATGNIEFVGSVVTAAGTLYLYIAGDPCFVSLAVGDTAATVATKVAARVTALLDLPVSGTVSGTTSVDFDSKAAGPWGNELKLTLNEGFQESTPVGVTAVITDMAGGTGIPIIADALTALGTGDDTNELGITDGVHGYGQDTTTLNAISTWNGAGNEAIGCYDKLVARPVRFLVGDTAAGSAGLADLVALGNSRTSDRTNGVIAVPGSCNHPDEIAAIAIGIMARINNNRAAESYLGKILTGVFPGALADRWTADDDSRDIAVKTGVSPTVVSGGAVLLKNVLSFYHPENVTVSSNGYRSMRNISIVQNLLSNVKANFAQEKWQGISIVADIAKVSNIVDRQKARDIEAVMDDLLALVTSFESHAWIYSAAFTVARLQAGGCIAVRAGGIGFDITLPVMLSGEGGIFDTEVQFDTNLSIVL